MPDAKAIERIQRLIGEILRKASARDDTCLYRGEPERYPIVSTGLCRTCPETKDEMFDITTVEREIVAQATNYTMLTDPLEILAEIQHFGGTTNLLDFTDDYLIALFFACADSPDADGRVVLHWPDPKHVIRPKHTNHRVIFQKSVFVRPQRGFIVPDALDEVVPVPCDLKASVLTFLNRFHGISETSVYNDIHGFIRHQNPSRSAYAADFRTPCHCGPPKTDHAVTDGLREVHQVSPRYYLHQHGMDYADRTGSLFVLHTSTGPGQRVVLEPDEVVRLLTHCIEQKIGSLTLAQAHCWRGTALLFRQSDELAEADFERALSLDGELAEAYHGCANLCIRRGNLESGKADLEKALMVNAKLHAALIDRGNLHLEDGSLDAAIVDFDTAMKGSRLPGRGPLQSNYTWFRDGRFFRATARCMQRDWHKAEEDFAWAKRGGLRVASSFQGKFGGVEQFEREHAIKLPSRIKTLLHVRGDG